MGDKTVVYLYTLSRTNAAVAYRTDRQRLEITGCQFIGHHLVPHLSLATYQSFKDAVTHTHKKSRMENKSNCVLASCRLW